MLKYKKITVIGTSHISPKSVQTVRTVIKEEKPAIVAIELDMKRYQHLMSKEQGGRISLGAIRQIGITGFVIAVFGAWAEKKLGELTGSSPGQEMLAAVRAGKKEKAIIAFIDRDISITLSRLNKKITAKEKLRFIGELITAPFKKRKLAFDIRKVPTEELIEKLIGEVKVKYPNVYQVLIHERDIYMAKALNKLGETNKKIVAVVGAGHEKGIIKTLTKLEGS
tara:strand:- start:264 stop:935 length:672 start_codon:yes stop_codon:yes gene_type:complete